MRPVHDKKSQKDDDDFQWYPCFNHLPSESLDDCASEVEALVAGSKNDEKKLIGPRFVGLVEFLVRVALARNRET